MSKRIVDACCLINLYASGELMSILDDENPVYISQQVKDEALWIRGPDQDNPHELVPQRINLQEAIESGRIIVCNLEGLEELDSYIEFARELDDGEASSLAIAMLRGWKIATDDRKGRRIATENKVELLSTSEMIRNWSEIHSLEDSQVSKVLKKIERFGRFKPRSTDSLYNWWNDLASS